MRGEIHRRNAIFLSQRKNRSVMDQYFSGSAHNLKNWFRTDQFLFWDGKRGIFLNQKSFCVSPSIFLFPQFIQAWTVKKSYNAHNMHNSSITATMRDHTSLCDRTTHPHFSPSSKYRYTTQSISYATMRIMRIMRVVTF